jgi:small-conductance mechanosensitive channel
MTTNRTPNEADDFSTGRVLRIAAILVAVGAVAELVLFRTWMGALSLTAAGLVAMINFRWLEVIVHRVVQPGKARFDRWTVLRILGRLILLAGILAALTLVPRIDAVAVAIGFTTLVVALVIEGLRHARVGGG